MTATMNKGEREALQVLIRQRERVLKSAAKQRSSELLADFETSSDRSIRTTTTTLGLRRPFSSGPRAWPGGSQDARHALMADAEALRHRKPRVLLCRSDRQPTGNLPNGVDLSRRIERRASGGRPWKTATAASQRAGPCSPEVRGSNPLSSTSKSAQTDMMSFATG
jgi:hypothetical protein